MECFSRIGVYQGFQKIRNKQEFEKDFNRFLIIYEELYRENYPYSKYYINIGFHLQKEFLEITAEEFANWELRTLIDIKNTIKKGLEAYFNLKRDEDDAEEFSFQRISFYNIITNQENSGSIRKLIIMLTEILKIESFLSQYVSNESRKFLKDINILDEQLRIQVTIMYAIGAMKKYSVIGRDLSYEAIAQELGIPKAHKYIWGTMSKLRPEHKNADKNIFNSRKNYEETKEILEKFKIAIIPDFEQNFPID